MGSGLLYVQAAQRLDLQPITLSDDPTRYDHFGAKEAETIRVDTDDLDALIRECSQIRATYEIAGITGLLDSVYATVGKLCRHFDLPGPNPGAIEQCCDKYTQRQLLAAAGVPIPAYRSAANAAEVEGSAAIGLPVIVKPAVGSSSVGVRLQLRFWGHKRLYKKHRSSVEYFCFCVLVTVVGAARAIMLAGLQLTTLLGASPSSSLKAAISLDNGDARCLHTSELGPGSRFTDR